jgi:hypothetical protein
VCGGGGRIKTPPGWNVVREIRIADRDKAERGAVE